MRWRAETVDRLIVWRYRWIPWRWRQYDYVADGLRDSKPATCKGWNWRGRDYFVVEVKDPMT